MSALEMGRWCVLSHPRGSEPSKGWRRVHRGKWRRCRRKDEEAGGKEMTTVLKKANSRWKPEEEEQLRKLIESGVSAHDIAATLERTTSAVKGRANLLGISIKLVNFGLKAKGK
jgi:hypothetical protein